MQTTANIEMVLVIILFINHVLSILSHKGHKVFEFFVIFAIFVAKTTSFATLSIETHTSPKAARGQGFTRTERLGFQIHPGRRSIVCQRHVPFGRIVGSQSHRERR